MAAGSGLQDYYHLPSRTYGEFVTEGSCLCQTGLRKEVLHVLQDACVEAEISNSKNIDQRFWKSMRELCKTEGGTIDIFTGRRDVVGMKGLPGRPGLGVGHKPRNKERWRVDFSMAKLREWIGDDATLYESLIPWDTSETTA